jgi:two-component system, chemotaxis family, protein-glutamate methylesterase/glutaminase
MTSTRAARKYKVLIIDDSAVVRKALSAIISSDPELTVMATAADPLIAAERIRKEVPDVITLDVEMPRMDGLTFLHKVMSQHPIPVVIISSLAGSGSETALKALELGAVDIIEKPSLGTRKFIEEAEVLICDAVKAAAQAKVRALRSVEAGPKLTADAVISKRATKAMAQTTEKVLLIGASTGGTEALRVLLRDMPHDSPGIVIVQHMPEKFTSSFARHLDEECGITVKEAADNDTIIRGRALIAPGNRHTLLKRSGARYYVEIKDGPLVSRHRPSVDVLFRSGAEYAGRNAVGAILTGMGSDGAKGLLEMKEAGAYTMAQDEESCVVFGMPKEAIRLGAANEVLPLKDMAGKLLDKCRASVVPEKV